MTGKRFTVLAALAAVFYFAEIHRLDYTTAAGPSYDLFLNDDLILMTASGDAGRRIALLLLGLGSVLAYCWNRRMFRRRSGAVEIAMLLFAVWAMLSVTWADDTLLAARRTASFLLLSIAAVVFGAYFGARATMRFLLFSSMTFVCIGFISEVALGTFTPGVAMYRFCGTLHPNHQAWNCCGAALASLGLALSERRLRVFFWSCCGIAVAGLVLTKSRTSIFAFCLAATFYIVLTRSRPRNRVIAITGIVICVVAIPVLTAGGSANALLLGRDLDSIHTLTGRTDLWAAALTHLPERPIGGYGFNAFLTPRRIAEFERTAGWAAVSLHSEYMDLLLGIGTVGCAIYLFIPLAALVRSRRLFGEVGDADLAFESAVVVCVLVLMCLETVSRDPNILIFSYLVAITRPLKGIPIARCAPHADRFTPHDALIG